MKTWNSKLMQQIEKHAADAPALGDGSTTPMTYAQLRIEVARFALLLMRHRVHSLAVLADNSPALVITDLACLEAGVAMLPIPPFFTAEQQKHAVIESGCSHMLHTTGPTAAADEPATTVSVADQVFSLRRQGSADRNRTPEGTRKITFTSGSTGTPKGLCLSEEQLLAPVRAIDSALSTLPLTRHLCVLPMAVLLENIAGVYASLYRGITCIVPGCAQTVGQPGDPGAGQRIIQCITTQNANSAIVVPELLKQMRHACEKGCGVPTSLVYLPVGGSALSSVELIAARNLGLPAYQGYGLSEAGSVVTLNRPGADRVESVGKVLDHQRVTVDDTGTLHVRGDGFLGVCGDCTRIETSEHSTHATGDLGRVDEEGYVYLSGRSKHVLITSYGRNVSPEWVEAELLADDNILQVCVWGDGLPALQALVVSSAPTFEIDRAIEGTNQRLPDYAHIASWQRVDPFTADKGQLTGNGKLRREAIALAYTRTNPVPQTAGNE